jgi:hypothetical protein
MAITDESGSNMVMPVAPMGGGMNNNCFGDGGWWWLILLFLVFGNGWGGGGFGMDGGLYPWLNNSQNINGGFRDQMLGTTIQGIQNSITSGFGDVQLGIAGVNQNICQTGNGVVNAVTGAQNAITSQMYNNTIADLERSFAAQNITCPFYQRIIIQAGNRRAQFCTSGGEDDDIRRTGGDNLFGERGIQVNSDVIASALSFIEV